MTIKSNDKTESIRLYDEVLAVLPADIEVKSVEKYGVSSWSETGCINAVNSDGSAVRYFLKYVARERGAAQLRGEYAGMKELYKAAPHMVPKPYGWGRVSSREHLFFYVCDFIPLDDGKMPNRTKLAKGIAQLHAKSVSPTGKFGFYLPTYDGWLPQDVGQWDETWTSCFTRILKGLWQADTEINGHWADLDSAMEATLTRVIPRLIGILEQDGRALRPCLIHGDLWEANIGTDSRTNEIYIFDPAAYYAHNEMEIALWRVSNHKMKDWPYCQEYLKVYGKCDEPANEWDDRLKLYGVKTKLMNSASSPERSDIRQEALQDLLDLIKLYGNKS